MIFPSFQQLAEYAELSAQDISDLEAIDAMVDRLRDECPVPPARLRSLRKRGLVWSGLPCLEISGRLKLKAARGRNPFTATHAEEARQYRSNLADWLSESLCVWPKTGKYSTRSDAAEGLAQSELVDELAKCEKRNGHGSCRGLSLEFLKSRMVALRSKHLNALKS